MIVEIVEVSSKFVVVSSKSSAKIREFFQKNK